MDIGSEHAIKLLDALAENNRMLAKLALHFREQPGVADVVTSVRCWKYPLNAFPFVEEYVEVELGSGRRLTWSLEITWDEGQWTVDYDVSETREHGQVDLIDFPDRGAQTLDDLVDSLLAATTELVACGTSFDFLPND